MSLIDSFVQGGFHGQIAEDFILILCAMFGFIFCNNKRIKRLWNRIEIRACADTIAIVFPGAFVLYLLTGLPSWLNAVGVINQVNKGGALLFHLNVNYWIFSRVGEIYKNTGHLLVWVGIMFVYFSFMYIERHNHNFALIAFLNTMALISLHEFYWNMFYLVHILSVHTFEMITLGGFVISQLWLCTVLGIWLFYFRNTAINMCKIILPTMAVAYSWWLWIGFPITLTANETTNPNILTQWYLNPFVNMIEITDWWLMAGITLVAYLIIKYKFYSKIQNTLSTIALRNVID